MWYVTLSCEKTDTQATARLMATKNDLVKLYINYFLVSAGWVSLKLLVGLEFLKHGTINRAQSIKGRAKDSAIAKLIELSRVISLSHTIEYPS